MRRIHAFALLAPLAAARLYGGVSYTGTFTQDDNLRVFYLNVPAPAAVTMRTFSYSGGTNSAGTAIARGGFDPTLSLYDSSGNLVALNRDGGCGNVAADSVTHVCWDSFLNVTLPAGNYKLILTQADNLPNGPALTDSFAYSGTGNFTATPVPAQVGFWDFTPNQRTGAYAVDIVGANTTAITTITSNPTLTTGIVNTSFLSVLSAASGPGATLTWSLVSGTLPTGVTLSGDGTLSGVPLTAGTYSFTVQVTDGIQPVTQTVTAVIVNALAITTSSLPPGTAGLAYAGATLAATGGSSSFTWTGSGLPAGMNLASNGQISGTPKSGGPYSVSVRVTDNVTNATATATLGLTIAYPALQLSGNGNLGEFIPFGAVSGGFTATGGNPPYKWSGTGMPVGFNLNTSTGGFSGSAPSPGTYSFTIQVTDSQTPAATATGTINFSVLGITTSSLPTGSVTSAYSAGFSATGGTAPYSFSSANLPSGLTLSPGGALSGTPKTVGSLSFTVQVTDQTGLTAASTFTVTVSGPATPLSVTGGTLTGGTVLTLYSTGLQASGGLGPYTWSQTGGTLPPGLSLSAAGTVSGNPKTNGSYSFTAQATDSISETALGTFTIVIAAPALIVPSATFPNGIVGQEYPLQILTATGGVGPYTFSIPPSALPPGLSFSDPQISGTPTSSGTFPFQITVIDKAGTAVTLNASIVIAPAHADLIISQSTVTFGLSVGSNGVPAPANITVRSSVVQQLLNFSVAVIPAASWLDVTFGGTTTPNSVQIALDPTALSLAAGSYSATVNITCIAPSTCAGNVQPVTVTLNVAAPPAQLSLTTNLLYFQALTSSPGTSLQSLGIQNTGGGTLTINSITPANNWLTVTGNPGTLSSGPAVQLGVIANSTGLPVGTTASSITINSSAGSVTVPVSILVVQNALLTLAPGGAQFSAPTGTPPGNPGGTFQVTVNSPSTVNWNASVQPGASWLSVTTPSGTASSNTPGTVNFALDPVASTALLPGNYSGTVRVTSSDVSNPVTDFNIVYNVTAATLPIRPQPVPGGLLFQSAVAGAVASQQTVRVFAASAGGVTYSASTSTNDGAAWLSVSPATGTASYTAPGVSAVSVNSAGLAAGTYKGGVSYAYAGASVRTVNVTLIVGSLTSSLRIGDSATGCVAKTLVATQVALTNNFQQAAGWPTPLSLKLVDNCGTPVNGAVANASFSNGDQVIRLTPVDSSSGTYSGTWTPQTVARQVTVLSSATATGLTTGSASVTGEVTANTVPILTSNGATQAFAAQVGGALAQGTVIQIYGTNLATQTATSTSTPLPLTLGGTSVLIGGSPVPLYYVSPGQINAQVPYELKPGNQYQIQVTSANGTSTSGLVQVSALSPGIAADLATGLVIAQRYPDNSLITAASPAKPGDILTIYLVGLGLTDTQVATGAAAPASPLIRPVTPPLLTINGVNTPLLFGGLTPTAVGLAQISFTVRANTPDGNLQLTVSQLGAQSSVILPVHH